MRFSIQSDVHLEFCDYRPKNNGADVLLLCGDILTANCLHRYPNPREDLIVDRNTSEDEVLSSRYQKFMEHCATEFPKVIAIAGNHEFYGGKWKQTHEVLKEFYGKFDIHYLDDECLHLSDDVAVFGGTLWTDMNRGDPLTLHSIRDMMNDFRVILNDELGYTKLKPATVMSKHRHFLESLKFHMSEHKNKKFIVMSHHAPSCLSIHERYKNDYLMNGGYVSRLEDFILDHEQIVKWCHGHTHTPFDYEIGQCTVLCNPRGYHWNGHSENSQFDENKIFEV